MQINGRLFYLLLLAGLLTAQGCLAAAVGYGAYKISESKTESAEKAQRSADLKTYAQYRVDMERVNTDREKAGLIPRPIMTQEEWISAQTAGRPAISPSPPPPATTATTTAPQLAEEKKD